MVNLYTLVLLALSQFVLATGQVCLKHASGSDARPVSDGLVRAGWYSVGIASMASWFFIWLHLMRSFDLNRLFAFEGLSPLLVAGASALFLEEKISARAWSASVLIAFGIVLVALF